MKRADQILALRNVYPGLATDTRIHHRQQCRRDLEYLHAAHVNRSREPGEITGHSPTEGDKRRVTVKTFLRGETAEFNGGGGIFRGISSLKFKIFRVRKEFARHRPVEPGNTRIHDYQPPAGNPGGKLTAPRTNLNFAWRTG